MNVFEGLKRSVVRLLLYPHRLLPLAIRSHGAKAALEDGTSFEALGERARRLAGHWAGRGLKPGDRVVIDLPNSAPFVEGRIGALLAGFVAVPCPPGTGVDRLGWMVEFVGARAYLGTRPEAVKGLDTIFLDPQRGDGEAYERTLRKAKPLARSPRLSGADLMTINFTSGTTGEPKGVMSTVGAWGWSLYSSLRENRVPVGRDEVFLHAVPLATAGSALLLPAVLSGAKSLFMPAWDATEAARIVEEMGVTRMFLTPTMLAEFLDAVRAGRRDTSSLRALIYGTEPVPAARLRKAIGVLGPVLQQGYGMAEALPPVSILHQDDHARAIRDGRPDLLASAGRPTRAVELKVFDEEDRALPAGREGSLRVRGRTVSVGYWRRPDLTAETRRHGYYVTGDVGFLDGEGYLRVCGRTGQVQSAAFTACQNAAESRSEVALAWVLEEGAGPVLHLVGARGCDAAAVGAELVQGSSGLLKAFRVHAEAPKSPSFKLVPAPGIVPGPPAPDCHGRGGSP